MFKIPLEPIDAFFEGMRCALTSFDPEKVSPKHAFDFIETEHLKAKLAAKGAFFSYGEQQNLTSETPPKSVPENQ